MCVSASEPALPSVHWDTLLTLLCAYLYFTLVMYYIWTSLFAAVSFTFILYIIRLLGLLSL